MVELAQAKKEKLQRERDTLMEVEKVLLEHGGVEVAPLEMYKDIFQFGTGMIQKNSKGSRDLVANPLIYMKNNSEKTGRYRILFEDDFEDLLKEASEYDFAITNGITYFGRKNVQQHASKMYAMIFDLDGVGEREAINLFSGIEAYSYIYPMPNYIVLSGHGLHLYYLFDWPLPLFPNIKLQLKFFKFAMTRNLWNGHTSTIKNVQYQGINQGFRVPGGKTKIKDYKSKVFRFNAHPWSLQQLCEYIPDDYRVDEKKLFKESKLSIEEAKRRFPDWYQKRVVEKMPRGTWKNKEDLYYWWYRRMHNEARFGHRYFCVMMLAIYAVKCGISREQLETDAYAIQAHLNALNRLEPFTASDIDSALECYDERYITFPIKDISHLTGIHITKNKRNYQSQKDHLEEARMIRDVRMRRQNKKWDENNGRKPKKEIVKTWRENNPGGTKYACIKETGLSKSTVYRWWES